MSGVEIERHGTVALFRLNDPAKLNAMSAAIRGHLERDLPALLGDPAVAVVVITGAGKAFCAGGDLREFADPAARGGQDVRRMMSSFHGWVRAMLDSETPVIAAVNGPAVGAGFSLALLADLVIAADSAYFRGGFAQVGVLPDCGIGWTLPRAVGHRRAAALLLTDPTLSAEQAVAQGIASERVADADLLDRALAVAAEIAAKPFATRRLAKTLLRRSWQEDWPAYLETEAALQTLAFASADLDEGVAAFLAKRKPVFTGR